MHKLFIVVFLLLSTLSASQSYISQIKVVDSCTHLTSTINLKSLKIKAVDYNKMEAVKAIRACEKSIKKHPNDPRVMFSLARAYSKGMRYKEGFKLAKDSCRAGDIAGCTLLGGYYDFGLYNSKRNPKKTYKLYMWSCSKGDPQACHNLSVLIDNQRSFTPKDSKKGEHYLMETCMGGLYPHACVVYANHQYFKSIEFDKNLYEYSTYKGCADGDDSSCSLLWTALEKNKDPLIKEKKFYSAKQSCNAYNAKACREVGDGYARLEPNRLNNIMALTFYEEGCSNGDERFSCWYAGKYLFSDLDGITQDMEKSFKYMKKSCYLGMNTFACYDLGNFFLYDEKYKNVKEAKKLLTRACMIGNVRSLYLGCEHKIEKCCKGLKKYREKNPDAQ